MINELVEGEQVNSDFLVKRKTLHDYKNKDGQFLNLVLSDRTGSVQGMVWDEAHKVADIFNAGDVINVYGEVVSFRDKLQIKINRLQPVPEEEVDHSIFYRNHREIARI